jgi:hypothetical protein
MNHICYYLSLIIWLLLGIGIPGLSAPTTNKPCAVFRPPIPNWHRPNSNVAPFTINKTQFVVALNVTTCDRRIVPCKIWYSSHPLEVVTPTSVDHMVGIATGAGFEAKIQLQRRNHLRFRRRARLARLNVTFRRDHNRHVGFGVKG